MRTVLAALAICFALAACDADEGSEASASPTRYVFLDAQGVDTVDTSGQTFRHALIVEMSRWIAGLTATIDSGAFAPGPGDVAAGLDFWFAFDDAIGASTPFDLGITDPVRQQSHADLASGKRLVDKLAGNDPEGQHADWSTAFQGWDDPVVQGPEDLVRHWFAELDALAAARAQGEVALDPQGQPIEVVYVSPTGLDYRELLQKFLLGAVAFSQGADDYLDDDLPGKGLLADNTTVAEAGATALAHGWDEGFGYFGASRDFGDYTDDELAGAGGRPERAGARFDFDEDGALDLTSEVVWGHALNAAKRDRGSVVATDFTGDAWAGFLAGRALIHGAGGTLSDEELAALRAHRDQVVGAWEQAIAATVVHYINEVLVDLAEPATPHAARAKHWSELKGFALSFQFNPRSPLNDEEFGRLHALIGQAPVLPGGDTAAYADRLREARQLVGTAYGFDAANLGDDAGRGGW
ncbi:MAG: DUF4856 domain-containing protein [Myxococcales bacterium]|nr:DUF4856 domain-containing protein [Myxococcales bacterium]